MKKYNSGAKEATVQPQNVGVAPHFRTPVPSFYKTYYGAD